MFHSFSPASVHKITPDTCIVCTCVYLQTHLLAKGVLASAHEATLDVLIPTSIYNTSSPQAIYCNLLQRIKFAHAVFWLVVMRWNYVLESIENNVFCAIYVGGYVPHLINQLLCISTEKLLWNLKPVKTESLKPQYNILCIWYYRKSVNYFGNVTPELCTILVLHCQNNLHFLCHRTMKSVK